MNKLETYNNRLKAAKLGTRIEVRGERLYIVATLPPKPSSDREWHQQRIALHKLSNHEGLSYAYKQAQLIGGQIATNNFNWENWVNAKTDIKTLGEWIEEGKRRYLENGKKEETWESEYWKIYKKFPDLSIIPTLQDLKAIFYSTPPNTRTRRRAAFAMAYLGDILGFDHDFRQKTGGYSLQMVSPRDIPSDSLISEIYLKISDPSWQWVYGVMAAYGVRNHEVMLCDFLDYPICYVHRGKTNERYSYPLYPEWAEKWALKEENRPNISGTSNSILGNRITTAFGRYEIPFSPYNLRHAWARRSIEFGLDPSLAASMMGHGLDVHTTVYQLWLTRETYDRAYQRIIDNPFRPKAP